MERFDLDFLDFFFFRLSSEEELDDEDEESDELECLSNMIW